MSYRLGVDLGTTHTAAAVFRDGLPTLVRLGTRTFETPSVLYLTDDGTWLVGEAAERRGAADPARLVRHFKRRLGDPVPVVLGGSPFSTQSLMAELLRHVVRSVHEQEAGPPDDLVVTHPADWGPFRLEMVDETLRLAGLGGAVTRAEPEAAVLQYAAARPLGPGQAVVVYDLGGGTFDAAVVRRADDELRLVGTPQGIATLGGSDFDEAVFRHVVGEAGITVTDVDLDDPVVVGDLARLRRDCTEAKEALSYDTQAFVRVSVAGENTDVCLTREQLETMLRPPLSQTLDAVRRALSSANVEASDVSAIVLAGGSSRIPLVRQLLTEAFECPIVSDGHPEHLIAAGAARPELPAGSGPPSDASREPTPAPATPPRADPVRPQGQQQFPRPDPDPEERHARVWHRGRGRRVLLMAAVLLLAVSGAIAGVSQLTREPEQVLDDPAADARPEMSDLVWQELPALPDQRDSPGVASHRGKIWVVGGMDHVENGTVGLDAVHVLDPASQTWEPGPELPRPIDHAALVSTGTRLLLIGGQRDSRPQGPRTAVATVYELEASEDGWRRGPALPGPRVGLAGAWDGQRVVVGGGLDFERTPRDEVWTLVDGTWEAVGTLQQPREHLAAASDGQGRTWFLGGAAKDGDGPLRAFGLTDVVVDDTVSPGPDIDDVGAAAALWTEETGPCVLGGRRPEEAWARVQCLGSGKPPPDLPIPLAMASAAVLDGEVYLIGGFSERGTGGTDSAFVLGPPGQAASD